MEREQNLLNACCTAILLFGLSFSTHAALESRLAGQAYYDTALDITWATDTSIGAAAGWFTQVAWVETLTIGGVDGWRLPSVDVNGDGVVMDCASGSSLSCVDNEFSHLYWEEGISPSSPGPFLNADSGRIFWSATPFAPSPFSRAWLFVFTDDFPESRSVTNGVTAGAWAVHDGDVGTLVPIPMALWLFASGTLSLIGMRRRH